MPRETRRFTRRAFSQPAPIDMWWGYPRGARGQGEAEDDDVTMKPAGG